MQIIHHQGPLPVLYVAYESGIIRNADGKLVAYFDRINKILMIDGIVQPFFGVADDEQAFELLHKNA